MVMSVMVVVVMVMVVVTPRTFLLVRTRSGAGVFTSGAAGHFAQVATARVGRRRRQVAAPVGGQFFRLALHHFNVLLTFAKTPERPLLAGRRRRGPAVEAATASRDSVDESTNTILLEPSVVPGYRMKKFIS